MSAESDQRTHEIAVLLLAKRKGTEDWGEISHLEGRPCSKKIANKFLVCCLLDWQMNSKLAWSNGYRLVVDLMGDPDDIWRAITSVPETDWMSRRTLYKLHRFPAGHNRLWAIGRRIVDLYDGDARKIWTGLDSSKVIERLLSAGAGEQISRMIVGALRDCGQISGSSDVKADVYVCRVLGRAMAGEPATAGTATEFARRLHPSDPWQLDWPLWNAGKSYCHSRNPSCLQCYLIRYCVYAQALLARISTV